MKTNTRLKYNLDILSKLSDYCIKHPEVRFQQALVNTNIIIHDSDLFYEESSVTLKRIKNNDKK